MNFVQASRALIALATVLILGACSKNESTETSAASPTPTTTILPASTLAPVPVATVSPAITPLPTSSPLADLDARMRDMEARMDSVFSDAFHGVGNWFDQSKLASSVDLREQNDKYIARVYVPRAGTSKIDAKIDNGALHITAQTENTASGNTTKENYEQVITLSKPVQADKMQIERKQNVVVISVPKATASAPAVASAATPSPTKSPAATTTATDWGDIMSNQFAEMQRRMDQTFRDVFGPDTSSGTSAAQLGSAVNVDEQSDKYVVHFYLPDRDLSNVKVNFENGRLALTAEEQKSSTNKSATGVAESTTAGRYEEMITLAGPVKDQEMKVERKSGEVIVTLPKA